MSYLKERIKVMGMDQLAAITRVVVILLGSMSLSCFLLLVLCAIICVCCNVKNESIEQEILRSAFVLGWLTWTAILANWLLR